MTDTHAIGSTQAVSTTRVTLGRAAAGAGCVVLGGVCQDAEFGDELHGGVSLY
ncbi:hypothetical protein D3C76_1772340 [compost metagenome]